MLLIGIDPGATGAVAIIGRDSGAFFAVNDLDSDPALIVDALDRTLAAAGAGPIFAAVERAQAMPKQGISSTAKYMTGYGVILGWLGARHLPYDTVRPTEWKKLLGLGSEKAAALALARRLFPGAELGLKKHHGRAEALLIAEWVRRERFIGGAR